MKLKPKQEAQLLKEALRVGAIYVDKRGAGQFEATDSASKKISLLYQLLVHDKLITPLNHAQETEQSMKHKLALWIYRQLPDDHPLKTD